jgi:ABC-type uncharacterized transport system substrate-binding protein
MSGKILIWLLATIVLTTAPSAEAQQPTKVPRLGFIGTQTRASAQYQVDGFRQGLRDRGYIEDKNIVVDYRYGEGRDDLLRDFAGDLVRLKVDIIVTSSTVAAIAAKQLTGTIPIVLAGSGDPVATGLVASLARPGANVTGLSGVSPELNTKQLDLIREIVPKVSRGGAIRSAQPDQHTRMERNRGYSYRLSDRASTIGGPRSRRVRTCVHDRSAETRRRSSRA